MLILILAGFAVIFAAYLAEALLDMVKDLVRWSYQGLAYVVRKVKR